MQITIAKFHLYPQEDPSGYAVGFNVTASNGRSFYTDTIIPLTETQGKTDDEIVALAYQELQQGISDRVSVLETRSSILSQQWVPPDQRDEQEPVFDDEDLDSVKRTVRRKLELRTQRFVETLPDGGDRYKWFHGFAGVNIKYSILAIPEGDRTQDMVTVLSRILEVEVWQDAVYSAFHAAIDEIVDAGTVEEVRAVEDGFDLSPFNATDPDVSLSEIMIF